MTITYGFEQIDERFIEELNTKAVLYRHVKTGAELLSLSNDDENKVFGVTFATPPADSTGLPHILEHSVLGGSRKYRVKEPFVELVKGSLKTFLNAMTGADRTMYPVASTNLQDFYNLIDVYLDAVFYPLLTPQHLEQEGWHYELDDKDDPLRYKGIVFNEMKGVYSSPDDLLHRYNSQYLFPDNAYSLDFGGDPQVIPELTYEQFKQFHEAYYHPSNARIFFYGDDDPVERLRLLDKWLSEFEANPIEAMIDVHTPFSQPRRVVERYAIDAESDSNKKGMIMVSWVLPEITEPTLIMSLNILSDALVGTSAAPLRKALIDSGLGEDVTGDGLSGSMRQMTFSIGLKGIDLSAADAVESLIIETLAALAEKHIEKDTVDAALNTLEFDLRENNTGSYPRGLLLMMRTLHNWLFNRDPIATLQYEAPLTAVKAQLQDSTGYLSDLIRRYLLDNNHRLTLILEPDPSLQQELETAEQEKLATIKAGMDQAQLEAVIANTQALKRLQEQPDSPEALATIPRLTLADLDKENKPVPLEVSQMQGAKLLYHDLFTNGIVYLDLGFDLHVLPPELLPYVKLYGRCLTQIGTETEDFVTLSQRIGRQTGDVSASSYVSGTHLNDEAAVYLFLRGKATMSQTTDLLAIMRDILLTLKLDNQERFRQMVLESKARKEASVIPAGHSVANARLQSQFSEAGWVAEQMGGVSYLFFLRELALAVENDWPSVLAKLEQIHHLIINRNALIVNVTLENDNWQQFRPQLDEFLTHLPAGNGQRATWQRDLHPPYEGLTIPAQVNYVVKGVNLYEHGYQLDGSISVIGNFLRTSWLWEKIRAQGGAYGAMCSFNRHDGTFVFLSYRDPNLLETLANYDKTADFLRGLELNEGELVKSIIGTISSMDSYQLPDAKGHSSMMRYLTGYTDEARQTYREQILTTTTADFKAFADTLTQVRDNGRIVVLGSAEAIKAANEQLATPLALTKVM
jgi:presequence protease